jgi:hypothetical protein
MANKQMINKLQIIFILAFFTNLNFAFAQTNNANKNSQENSQENLNIPAKESVLDAIDEDSDNSRYGNYAVIQALNKTTAKTSYLELKVGEKFNFGSIRITPHKCWQSPLSKKPENKILLEISDVKNEGDDKQIEKRIFFGWMFSSSPSISGLEHPIYDVIAINCKLK